MDARRCDPELGGDVIFETPARASRDDPPIAVEFQAVKT
jgi:hypothetical protein